MPFRSLTVAAGALALGASTMFVAAPAAAQGACESLWHQRNSIYARNGYCFQTARARSVFGAGCFPPYGEMSRGERRQVNQIQAEEDALGCPR